VSTDGIVTVDLCNKCKVATAVNNPVITNAKVTLSHCASAEVLKGGRVNISGTALYILNVSEYTKLGINDFVISGMGDF
jgi:hypothetical protein